MPGRPTTADRALTSKPAPVLVVGVATRLVTETASGLRHSGPWLVALAALSFTVHHLLISAGARIALQNGPAGLALLTLAITVRLVALAVMVLVAARALRIDLGPIATILGVPPAPAEPTSRRQVLGRGFDALVAAMGPLVLLYAGWQLVNQDLHQFLLGLFNASSENDFVNNSNINFREGWRAFLGWAVGVWLLKLVVEQIRRRTGRRALDLVLVVLETAWIVLAWLVVTSLLGRLGSWLRTREATHWGREAISAAADVLAPLAIDLPAVLSFLGRDVVRVVEIGFFQVTQPLVWVAAVGLVLGWGATEASLTSGSRVAGTASARWSAAPRQVRFVLSQVSSGWREKWVPVLAVIRLIWRSGPVPLLTIAALWAVGSVAGTWLQHLAVALVDPNGLLFQATTEMVMRLVTFLLSPVLICFLVATFAEILALRTRAEVSGSTGDSARHPRGFPAPGPRG